MEDIEVGDVVLEVPAKLLLTSVTATNSKIGQMVIELNIESSAKMPLDILVQIVFIMQERQNSESLWKDYIALITEA